MRVCSARVHGVPAFLLVPLLLAYVEEGLWDGLVWTEHPSLVPDIHGAAPARQ